MSFDPNSDNDIEDFITEVKALQNLLNLPNKLVVTTLTEKFPSHRLHFINVKTMTCTTCLEQCFLKTVTASAANLCSTHQAVGTKFSFQNGKSLKNRKGITFDQNKLIKNAMERLIPLKD